MLLARSFSTLVAIVFCFGALAGFDASRAAEERSANVQVGDLVLAVPADVAASFGPGRAGASTSFDYSKVGPAQTGIRRVDHIFIKLHRFWPTHDRSTNEVVSISADSRAEKSDFFCRSTSRKGSEPDEAAAMRLDGDFFVFAEQYTAGPVYMSRGARAFGAPITAWGVATTAFSKDLRGQARPITKFSFSIALTPNVELSIRFTEEQIPRDQWPNFFEKLRGALHSWIRAPDPSTFRWRHEQSPACADA